MAVWASPSLRITIQSLSNPCRRIDKLSSLLPARDLTETTEAARQTSGMVASVPYTEKVYGSQLPHKVPTARLGSLACTTYRPGNRAYFSTLPQGARGEGLS